MINARIIDAVPLDDQIELKKCQMEIALEDNCKLVVQFDDLKCWMNDDEDELDKRLMSKCTSCQELNKMEQTFKTDEDYILFLNKYSRIKSSSSESQWLTASKADLINAVSSLVSCVGCRTSLERFYRSQTNKLVKKSHNFSSVIYPFLIKSNDSISLCSNILDSPFKLFSIFNLKK
ncbi:gametogenetin-binding 2-like [Brachionus plicatilis]|uniref:Gametogenetin-binding 2-like n=1 Tax=Brachionus plicatilis TaxID=10195 RepID=A0A3M7RBB8_BRAPC|nr:gametogenetin-binding 2-like [Brachionus plicatilis]